jgi:branched-chain amino acid transport system substrate-binding protein
MAASSDSIAVGVLFSSKGPYAALGREGHAGAMTAIAEINESPDYDFALLPHVRDPEGSAEQYAVLSQDIIATSGARHIVGCTTSWSRKEVIPVLEKHGTMLWYPCPYEGFECNEQVVYLGACPNQHILPLLQFVLPRFGNNAFLVGSNYIWGWETCRIARDIVEHSGGAISGERFVPLGCVDIERVIAEIRQKRPNFVVNTLVGPSCYAFLKAYHQLGRDDPAFHPDIRPVISCNFSESEADELGGVAEGQYVIAPYFQSLPTPQNQAFLCAAARLMPEARHVSAFFAQSYTAIHMIAQGIRLAGSDAPEAMHDAHDGAAFQSPFGPVEIDQATNHAILTPRIARIGAGGAFDIIVDNGVPVFPDPYLAHSKIAIVSGHDNAPSNKAPHLRVVK